MADMSFTRDRLTRLTYGMAITFGFGVAAMGPAMPLLREDLGISRTIGGLHFSAIAVGSVAAGIVVERIARIWGRRRVFWAGGAGVAIGALLIGIGWNPVMTLLGAFLIGSLGSALLIAAQAAVSDRHPAHRSVALTELNTAMSAGTIMPALLIGGLVAVGIGWRVAFVAPLLGAIIFSSLWRSEVFPAPLELAGTRTRRGLPGAFWLYVGAFAPSVAAEWCVGAWGADYLVDIAGIAEGSAAFLMTAFFGAILVGRLIGSRIAEHVQPFWLLLGASLIGLVGVLVFWGSTTVVPVVAGLLLTGLGVSMQFPMTMSLAIGTVPDLPDFVAARASIVAGASVLVAPLTVGALADYAGIRAAFGVVPGFFVLVAVFAAAGRFRRRVAA